MTNARGSVPFRVVAAREGHGWAVHVVGLAGPSRFDARDLADIEPRALKMIWGYTGVDYDRVDIEVRLPGVIQDRLGVIRQLCADLAVEHDAARSRVCAVATSTGRSAPTATWTRRA